MTEDEAGFSRGVRQAGKEPMGPTVEERGAQHARPWGGWQQGYTESKVKIQDCELVVTGSEGFNRENQ